MQRELPQPCCTATPSASLNHCCRPLFVHAARNSSLGGWGKFPNGIWLSNTTYANYTVEYYQGSGPAQMNTYWVGILSYICVS